MSDSDEDKKVEVEVPADGGNGDGVPRTLVPLGGTGAKVKNCAPTLKVVLVGDNQVGKTTLCTLMETGNVPRDYIPTVFDNATINQLRLGRNAAVGSVGLWDTAGHDDYDRLRPLSYPQTDAFLVCFSLTDPATLERVREKWVPELTHHAADTPWILCGLKADRASLLEGRDPDSPEALAEAEAAAAAAAGPRGGPAPKEEVVPAQTAIELARELGAKGYIEVASHKRLNHHRALVEACRAAVAPEMAPKKGGAGAADGGGVLDKLKGLLGGGGGGASAAAAAAGGDDGDAEDGGDPLRQRYDDKSDFALFEVEEFVRGDDYVISAGFEDQLDYVFGVRMPNTGGRRVKAAAKSG